MLVWPHLHRWPILYKSRHSSWNEVVGAEMGTTFHQCEYRRVGGGKLLMFCDRTLSSVSLKPMFL